MTTMDVSEAALFLLNAALDRIDPLPAESAAAFVAELSPDDLRDLVPALATIAASAMYLLSPADLERWRATSRTFLATTQGEP